jgi:two-component system response regulator FixJ
MTSAPLVYIVDDDAAVRDSLRLLLHSHGLQSCLAASAHDFLQNRDPARAGCLVLDERMPGCSGLELLRLLRQRGASLPTIVMSGHCESGLTESAREAGVVAFIAKPFNPEQFITVVRQALALVDPGAGNADK